MVDVTKFLIISTTQFESIVNYLGCSLTNASEMYMITYLFTNLLAYIIIFAFIFSVMWVYRQLFSRRKRSWL